jgi:hypothetical protein
MVMRVLRFAILCAIKSSRYFCYPTKITMIGTTTQKSWDTVRLVILLNHTSLFEFIFSTAIPVSYLWKMSNRLIFPVAEETLVRPVIGRILRLLAPRVLAISRRRDRSWEDFLTAIRKTDSILIYLPEGRMKRVDGFDKNGGAMTVRGGLLDVLQTFSGSDMMIVYSGGLHHVLAPGQIIPRPFQTIEVALEFSGVDGYLQSHQLDSAEILKQTVARDFERRRDIYCPRSGRSPEQAPLQLEK